LASLVNLNLGCLDRGRLPLRALLKVCQL
jgi:hypothetical protein